MLKSILSNSTIFFIISMTYILQTAIAEPESMCPNGANPDPNVIWCDSFEKTDLQPGASISDNYFEFDANNGDHARVETESKHGQSSLRARWQSGEIDAGHLVRNFGRNPLGTQSHNGTDFREIYWRFYLKYPSGTLERPDKLSRITSFADTNRAQSMIAHIWLPKSNRLLLATDPASGIDIPGSPSSTDTNQLLITTKWNDFSNLTWLGLREGTTQIQSGQWYCVEARVKLNDPGNSNGVFEMWINDNPETSRNDLNWVGDWMDYGINSLFISHWWNGGATIEQERYIDALVISQTRIGCTATPASSPPKPPTNVNVIVN